MMASERGADAIHRPGGLGAGATVRVMIGRLDEQAEFGLRRSTSRTARIDVRVADLPAPAMGDTLEIASVIWSVNEPPDHDESGLVWSLYCARIAE